MVKEYYEILKISENATGSDIRKAYINLARMTHPDKGGNGEEFKKVGEAYAVLGDEDKKRVYDADGTTQLERYGYDYDEEIEEGDMALKKYKDHIGEMEKAWIKARLYYSSSGQGEPASSYHLYRLENLLKLLNSYYKLKYLAARGEKERADLIPFPFWSNSSGQSNQTAWNNNFDWFLKYLNESRKVLDLRELTENDLRLKSIEGNDRNETPQIPDGEKPKIEGSKFDDYNNLYSRKNHEVHRKFEELYEKVIGQNYSKDGREWNQTGYDNLAKHPSFAEAYEKIKQATGGANQFIPHDADANQEKRIKEDNEKDLNKKREAIKLMEKVITESENDSNNSEDQNNSTSEPINNKRKAEVEFRDKNNKKSKTISDDLSRLVSEANDMDGYEELATKIKEIDKYQGEASYNEHQGEINQLKVRLGSMDKDKFRGLTIQKIKSIMADNKINDSDLDQETKAELARLESEEDIDKITELESKVSEKIGKKGALNTLNDWLQKAKELMGGVKKGTVEHLRGELKKVKDSLYNFQFSTNLYQQSIYNDKEKEVKEALEGLENYSFQGNTTQPTGSLPWGIIIPVSLTAVLAIAAVIIVRRKKSPPK